MHYDVSYAYNLGSLVRELAKVMLSLDTAVEWTKFEISSIQAYLLTFSECLRRETRNSSTLPHFHNIRNFMK